MLAEIDRLTAASEDFTFESTLGRRAYVGRLQHLKSSGYHLEIAFLRVASTRPALKRIAAHIRQGGHPVANADVLRRFERGWRKFESVDRTLADAWAVFENSRIKPILLERSA